MKITSNSGPASADRTQPSSGGTTRASATQSTGGISGGTQATGAAGQLSQLESQFALGSFDEQKVSEIRNAISQGSYQINAGAVADKLIASALQLTSGKG